MLSIRMLKICGDSLSLSLSLSLSIYLSLSLCGLLGLIFQFCFENGKFPSEWKKANVFPTYKKNNKELVKNYRPVSLFPICGKIFAARFHYFQENNLILPNQSGFKPGDSCANQLVAITHEIYKSFIFLKHLIKYGTKVLYIN